MLTADIAGYLRQGVSDGIYCGGELLKPGLVGPLWLTGNIWSYTSGPSDEIYDTFTKNITEAGRDKARTFGYSLANSVIDAAARDIYR